MKTANEDRQPKMEEQSARSAKLVSTNSIRKTFDLINLHFEILRNITAQSLSGTVTVESQSNAAQQRSSTNTVLLPQQASDPLTVPSKQEVIYDFILCFLAPAHKNLISNKHK